MADINGEAEDRLRSLLFFAYRDFTSDADAILARYAFGRAHHRVLHFVEQRPGLAVAELLDILRITKQSLSRVLKQLVDQGFIEQRAGPEDRRQRLLFLTDDGRALAQSLAEPQSRRIRQALLRVGEDKRFELERFLLAMVDPGEQANAAAVAGVSDVERDAGRSDCGGRGA